MAHHPLGYAADQDMLHPRIAMRADHDHFDFPLPGDLNNFLGRLPSTDDWLDGDREIFGECFQLFDKELSCFCIVDLGKGHHPISRIQNRFDHVHECDLCPELNRESDRVAKSLSKKAAGYNF